MVKMIKMILRIFHLQNLRKQEQIMYCKLKIVKNSLNTRDINHHLCLDLKQL